MGVRIDVRYAGELHCALTHGPSGSQVETDAPKDNAGKGEAFSPTDLLAASLASCAVTTMAIKAPGEGIDFGDADATIEKIMTTSGPRRVAQLEAVLHLSSRLSPEHRERLEAIARSCPVALSLSPDVDVEMRFVYDR
jgi:putative redox protein